MIKILLALVAIDICFSISNHLKLKKVMKTLDEVLQGVEQNNTLDGSLITLVQGLKQQLTDALSGANLPAPVQAKVDAIWDAISANNQKVSDAILANTTAEGTGTGDGTGEELPPVEP